MRSCQHDWPRSQKNVPVECRKHWHIRDSLYVCDGILFFGDRIIVPLQLRPEMLKLIHESHFDVEKCKSRARELLYWPRMSYDIESTGSTTLNLRLRQLLANVIFALSFERSTSENR